MTENKDKAYTFIFNEILDKILQLSENPSQFADYLTQQIREIIGARTIVIAIKNANQKAEIYSVFPQRRKDWANQTIVIELAEVSFSFETIQFFEKQSSNKKISSKLQQLDIEKSITIPLVASGVKVGSILLFDIMDSFGIEAVLDLLNRISGISALVIRNSLLYHNLEETVAIRTQELQKKNEELVVRDLQLEKANQNLSDKISEIQELNLQLKEALILAENKEAQTNDILRTAMDGFWLVDIKGNIKEANEQACQMLGYSYEELTKLTLFDVDAIENTEQTIFRINKVIKNKEERFETKHRCKNGKIINVELSVKFQEKYNLFVVFVRDISSRIQADHELIKAKEHAEESDRLKTAFLQNMSHEIRTPMNAIMGFSGLLAANFNDKNKLKKFSDIIGQRCNDLLDIINDILDIAKIESGQLSVNQEECNLGELFSELSVFFTEYQIRLGKQQIKFSMHAFCDPCNNIIVTDKVKLKQIFINLISNAFKFTEKGKIEGGCKYDENNNLLFYVSDTGIGIPADKQEMVFERFAQVHQGSKMNIGGTGLGLPIVKGLVGLLGGKVYLESEPEKGSTFSFTFPIVTSQVQHHKKLIPEMSDANILLNKTILIVEDDLYNAEYLKEILSGNSMNIVHTEYGKDAVKISLSQHIDLILMDIRLPDMNGYEATRQIIQHKPYLKIIAQTAYAAQDEKKKALDAGCIDYISKPTKADSLITMISKHLTH